MGDRADKIAYLDQNWTAADSTWFYSITQGSDLLPYDFFLALEQPDSQELFRSDKSMNFYRYLPQKVSRSNPDALPVGMVADTYKGKKFMGFTCAACHCSQVNYNGVGIRIDGGPGAADMDRFMNDLQAALQKTANDPTKRARFEAAVLQKGHYRNAGEIEHDLTVYALRLQAYNFFKRNNGALYGYSSPRCFSRPHL